MRREQPPSGALVAFNKATTYGPMFGCLVCQTHHFREGVVEWEEVRGLASREGRERFLDLNYILSNPCTFTQLDQQWVCHGCQASVDNGEMPALAARNGLQCTWASLPPALHSLSQEELELLGLTHLCISIHGLTLGVAGVGRPTKTLILPFRDVRDVKDLTECSRPPEEVLALHCRPHGQLPVVRAGPMMEAWDRLLEVHPLYRNITALGKETAKEFMQETLGGIAVVEEEMEGEGDDTQVNFFSREGPMMKNLMSIVLPTGDPRLTVGEKKIKNIASMNDKLFGIYDLNMETGVEVEREVPITSVQRLQHLVSNVQRSGPTNSAPFLLTSLLRYEMERLTVIREKAKASGGIGGPQSLMLHRGSDAYYNKIYQDLEALNKWRGPTAFSLTLSASAHTLDILGTRVSHLAGLEGRQEQVFHINSEDELTVRPGQTEQDSSECTYVHTRTAVKNDTCPFHYFCCRTPLKNRRERWVSKLTN